jgi:hypothetical protein
MLLLCPLCPAAPPAHPFVANSLAAAGGEPAQYRLLTFQVPNLMSLFRCLVRTKVSVQIRGFVSEYFVTAICFHGEELLAPRPTPKLEDHPFSAVRDWLFDIFAATLHIGGRSSIRNLRTRRAVVTGTHLSHGHSIAPQKIIIPKFCLVFLCNLR